MCPNLLLTAQCKKIYRIITVYVLLISQRILEMCRYSNSLNF